MYSKATIDYYQKQLKDYDKIAVKEAFVKFNNEHSRRRYGNNLAYIFFVIFIAGLTIYKLFIH